jgi:hypothetical protein
LTVIIDLDLLLEDPLFISLEILSRRMVSCGSTLCPVSGFGRLTVITLCVIIYYDKKLFRYGKEQFYVAGKSRKIPATIHKAALRKLGYLNGAVMLDDLKVPPANRLERLKGDL